MGNGNFKVRASITSAVLVTALLTGCSSNTETPQAQDPTPSQSESSAKGPAPSESASSVPEVKLTLDYDAEIELANNELELEFLTIALASCKKAQQEGFVLSYDEGESYFRPAQTGIFLDWPFDEVTVKDGKTGPAFFNNYPPAIFNPCSLEGAARSGQAGLAYLEHSVQLWASNSYGWSQHNGGANVDEIVYQVTDGLITRYGPYNNMSNVVTYGPLNQAQLELFGE